MTTLRDAIDHYIAWQRSHGVKFVSGVYLLNSFCRGFHQDTECDAVTEAQVRAFLAGNGPLTRSRATRYGALAGFYRYAISRRYASCSPLPGNEPPRPRSAPPYIYSHDELKRIFGVIDGCRRDAAQARRRDVPHADPASVRNRIAPRGGVPPDRGGCRPRRGRADGARHQVLQKPAGPGRSTACRCAADLRPTPCRTPDAGGASPRTSWQIGMARRSAGRRYVGPLRRSCERLRSMPGTTDVGAPCVHSAAAYLRRSPADFLVPAGSRCAASAAGPLHPSRASRPEWHSDLPVDDTRLLLHEASQLFERYVHGESDE